MCLATQAGSASIGVPAHAPRQRPSPVAEVKGKVEQEIRRTFFGAGVSSAVALAAPVSAPAQHRIAGAGARLESHPPRLPGDETRPVVWRSMRRHALRSRDNQTPSSERPPPPAFLAPSPYFNSPPSRPSHSFAACSLLCALRTTLLPPSATQSRPWRTRRGHPIDAFTCCLFALPQVTCNLPVPCVSRLTRLFWLLGAADTLPRADQLSCGLHLAPGLVCPRRSPSRRINTQPKAPPGLDVSVYLVPAVCDSSHICQLLAKADHAHYTYLFVNPFPVALACHSCHKRSTDRWPGTRTQSHPVTPTLQPTTACASFNTHNGFARCQRHDGDCRPQKWWRTAGGPHRSP